MGTLQVFFVNLMNWRQIKRSPASTFMKPMWRDWKTHGFPLIPYQPVLMYQRGWLTGQPLPDLCTKIQADDSLLQWKPLDPQSMSMIFCVHWNLEEDPSNKIESMMCPGWHHVIIAFWNALLRELLVYCSYLDYPCVLSCFSASLFWLCFLLLSWLVCLLSFFLFVCFSAFLLGCFILLLCCFSVSLCLPLNVLPCSFARLQVQLQLP